MPTDEDDHDDNFLFNHPERGGELCCRLGAHSRCYHCLDPIPPTEKGAWKKIIQFQVILIIIKLNRRRYFD